MKNFEIGKIYRKTNNPKFIVRIISRTENSLINGDYKESFLFEHWNIREWHQWKISLWNRGIYEEMTEEEFLIYRMAV
jgi:hypothetical protein